MLTNGTRCFSIKTVVRGMWDAFLIFLPAEPLLCVVYFGVVTKNGGAARVLTTFVKGLFYPFHWETRIQPSQNNATHSSSLYDIIFKTIEVFFCYVINCTVENYLNIFGQFLGCRTFTIGPYESYFQTPHCAFCCNHNSFCYSNKRLMMHLKLHL